ncbi:TlpA disulfide reductase family protein [Jatrophihabitans sp. YIM 134969]
MAVLVAVVVVLAVALCINLVLTFGVVRRLQDHETRLARGVVAAATPWAPEPAMSIADGGTVHPFMALSSEDEPVTREGLSGPTLVAFLSTHCSSCRDALPGVVDAARSWPGGRERVLGVVVGEPEGGDDDVYEQFRSELAPVAKVVRDVDGGQVPVSFGVQGFPVVAVVDVGGRVVASGYDLSDLPLPVGR